MLSCGCARPPARGHSKWSDPPGSGWTGSRPTASECDVPCAESRLARIPPRAAILVAASASTLARLDPPNSEGGATCGTYGADADSWALFTLAGAAARPHRGRAANHGDGTGVAVALEAASGNGSRAPRAQRVRRRARSRSTSARVADPPDRTIPWLLQQTPHHRSLRPRNR